MCKKKPSSRRQTGSSPRTSIVGNLHPRRCCANGSSTCLGSECDAASARPFARTCKYEPIRERDRLFSTFAIQSSRTQLISIQLIPTSFVAQFSPALFTSHHVCLFPPILGFPLMISLFASVYIDISVWRNIIKHY